MGIEIKKKKKKRYDREKHAGRRKVDSLCGGPRNPAFAFAVAVAAVYEEDADISSRPRMPRRAFNIGNGLRESSCSPTVRELRVASRRDTRCVSGHDDDDDDDSGHLEHSSAIRDSLVSVSMFQLYWITVPNYLFCAEHFRHIFHTIRAF